MFKQFCNAVWGFCGKNPSLLGFLIGFWGSAAYYRVAHPKGAVSLISILLISAFALLLGVVVGILFVVATVVSRTTDRQLAHFWKKKLGPTYLCAVCTVIFHSLALVFYLILSHHAEIAITFFLLTAGAAMVTYRTGMRISEETFLQYTSSGTPPDRGHSRAFDTNSTRQQKRYLIDRANSATTRLDDDPNATIVPVRKDDGNWRGPRVVPIVFEPPV